MNSRYNAISKRFMAFISVAYYVVFIIFTSVIIGFDEKFNVDSKGSAMYWMKDVDDGKKICDMNIPGTHDSGARYTQGIVTGVVASCQNSSIYSQLNSGIRYLDLRVDSNGTICHGILKCYKSMVTNKENELKLSDVLDYVEKFLENNSSEFVILQIKREGKNSDKNEFNNKIGNLLKSKSKYYYRKKSGVDLSTLTVSDVRGKFLVFARDCGDIDGGAFVYSNWGDNESCTLAKIDGHDCFLQDEYKAKTKNEKIECIKNFYSKIWEKDLSGKFVVNFTSCVGYYILWAVAMQINPSFKKFLEKNNLNKKFGIVLMDFPNGNLIESIYKTNF